MTGRPSRWTPRRHRVDVALHLVTVAWTWALVVLGETARRAMPPLPEYGDVPYRPKAW